MKRKFAILLFSFSLLVFAILFIKSSPYRVLRPYEFFGRRIPEKLGIETININGRTAVKITEESDEFYIDQIPVTIGSYRKCVAESLCSNPHFRVAFSKYWQSFLYNSFPVTFVTWYQAKEYCNRHGGNLPTAHQWEIAAGPGRYAWGDESPSITKANIDGWYQSHTPAGWLPDGASPYGVLDMNGNVREWVLDENDAREKGLKGASFNDTWSSASNENIFWHEPGSSGFNRGFRCV